MLFRKSLIITVGLILAVTTIHADTKVVQITHTGAIEMMGHSQPAADRETVTWFTDDRMAAITGDTDFIVRLDQKKVYVINHNDKTYSELTLPFDVAAQLPPQMAQMFNFEVTVTPTDEYKQVGEWRARRYNLNVSGSMLQMEQVIWTTTEVDVDFAKAKELSMQILSLQPGMESMVEEMAKIEGFQIAMEATTTAMGSEMTSSTETVSIAPGTPPSGTYDPPSGYTLEEYNPMRQR